MVNIQSVADEIRRGIKKDRRRRKKPQGKNIMVCPMGDHNQTGDQYGQRFSETGD